MTIDTNVGKISFEKITLDNFNAHSLDDFKRYQVVTQTLQKINGEYVYADNHFIQDWDSDKLRDEAADILEKIAENAIVYGAFCDGKVVGMAYLGTRLFGSQMQYIELECFQVSYGFRGIGIGKTLFSLVCGDALKTKATKLYISSHPAKESHEAYRHLGCVLATEYIAEKVENEPFDIQLEYVLR